MPMLPPAPARFSTTTGWPHLSLSFCATIRASDVGRATRRLRHEEPDGLFGKSCAGAAVESTASASQASQFLRHFIMRSPSFLGRPRSSFRAADALQDPVQLVLERRLERLRVERRDGARRPPFDHRLRR